MHHLPERKAQYPQVYPGLHTHLTRSQKCGLEGVRDGGEVWGGGCAPSPENFFGIFSFEMVHFDAFWSTFRSTVIVTVMFITSPPRGLTKINMKSTV